MPLEDSESLVSDVEPNDNQSEEDDDDDENDDDDDDSAKSTVTMRRAVRSV